MDMYGVYQALTRVSERPGSWNQVYTWFPRDSGRGSGRAVRGKRRYLKVKHCLLISATGCFAVRAEFRLEIQTTGEFVNSILINSIYQWRSSGYLTMIMFSFIAELGKWITDHYLLCYSCSCCRKSPRMRRCKITFLLCRSCHRRSIVIGWLTGSEAQAQEPGSTVSFVKQDQKRGCVSVCFTVLVLTQLLGCDSGAWFGRFCDISLLGNNIHKPKKNKINPDCW